jgi:hypothetical protein
MVREVSEAERLIAWVIDAYAPRTAQTLKTVQSFETLLEFFKEIL